MTPPEFATVLQTAVSVIVGCHVLIAAFQLVRRAAHSV